MSTVPSSAQAPLVCWNCHERTLGTHFCASCGKLLQLPQGIDYFALFEMPRNLWIEMGALEQKFLQLSWKLHPDNFVNASEPERELSLRRSSELNDAYRTLRDPIARAIGVPSIASGVSPTEVIAVFLLLFAASFFCSRHLLDRN